MLPNEELSRKSFFDENALMAGLVRREFSNARAISRFADKMKNLPSNEYAIYTTIQLHYINFIMCIIL